MQLFFQHIQGAVVQYSNTGELPHSLFRWVGIPTCCSSARPGGARHLHCSQGAFCPLSRPAARSC
jgi:hypothetical protein